MPCVLNREFNDFICDPFEIFVITETVYSKRFYGSLLCTSAVQDCRDTARSEATTNSPSAEAVGVGKAETWLTTFRARSWKRTKRPTDFGAILKHAVSDCPGGRYILAVCGLIPSPWKKKCWMCGQLRSAPAGRWCWNRRGRCAPVPALSDAPGVQGLSKSPRLHRSCWRAAVLKPGHLSIIITR